MTDTSVISHGYADVGEVLLHYVVAGNGPPVVLLHGWPMTYARDYRGRLLSRPSIVRVVNEARPYRPPSQRVRLRLMPAECHLWMLSKRAEALRVQ